jgi:uncharacterized protein
METLIFNPTNIHVYPSSICNLACRYCWNQGGTFGMPNMGVMSLETAEATVQFIAQQAVRCKDSYLSVSIFGGEPMMNSAVTNYIINALEEIRNQQEVDLRVLLFTNGTILNPDTTNLMAGKHHMEYHIGLDGPESAHDRYRIDHRGKGTYQTVIDNIRSLQEKNILVVAESVVTFPYDYIQLMEEYDHLKINYAFVQDEIIPIRGKGGAPESVASFNLELWEDKYREFCDHYINRLVERQAPLLDPLFGIIKFFLPDRYNPPVSCTAGTKQISISANGDIYACNQLQEIDLFHLGDVFSGKDKKLYCNFSELLLKDGLIIEKNIKCRVCSIRDMCRGGCYAKNHLHSGNIGSIEDEAVCEYRRIKAHIHQHFVRRMLERFPSYLEDIMNRNYRKYFPLLNGLS